MDLSRLSRLGRLASPRVWDALFRAARRVPFVRERLQAEYDSLLGTAASGLRPYSEAMPPHSALPREGVPRPQVLEQLRELAERERAAWASGHVSGGVYQGEEELAAMAAEIYALHLHANPLHADVWPSQSKFEAEIVAMTASMLGAEVADRGAAPEERVCGAVTSGGTESILLAMKSYRDRARAERGVTRPEMVVPVTAHAAFDKACEYFGMTPRRIEVDASCRARVREARAAINRNTVVVVGSAPSFPHGAIDPIPELAELARARGVGFHTDACLGGFVLPWVERLGRAVPPFDFRVPGVTSMSADTHKYGYAAKGTSVVLYRGHALRRHQYFATTEWPGGMYFSPTLAGSRPGALVAICWATLVTMGERGYIEATRRLLEAADLIKRGIAETPGLRVLGDPLWVIAFASDDVDVYRVLDLMHARGWVLNGLHKPASVHIAVTPRHAQPGVAESFVADLRACVEEARRAPAERGGMAPVYGLAASMPVRGAVKELLLRYVDRLYEP